MLSSISGQNERWAQLGVYPPVSSQFGKLGGTDSANPAASPAGASSGASPADAPSPALSDDLSFRLMALSAGQTTTQTTSPTTAAAADTSNTGISPTSQLYTDMQSLMSVLTGTAAPAATAGSGLSTTASAVDPGGSDASAADPGTAMLKDIQTVSADLAAMASPAAAASPPDGTTVRSNGLPPWRNDISNVGTSTSGGRGGWTPTYNDGFQKKFALNAYSVSSHAVADQSATAAVTSFEA